MWPRVRVFVFSLIITPSLAQQSPATATTLIIIITNTYQQADRMLDLAALEDQVNTQYDNTQTNSVPMHPY